MKPSEADMAAAREALTYERPCPCFNEDADVLSPKRCTDGFCRVAIERIAAALAGEREKCAEAVRDIPRTPFSECKFSNGRLSGLKDAEAAIRALNGGSQ